MPGSDLDLAAIEKSAREAADGWWCPTCAAGLDGSRVTHAEHCDTCGTYLGGESALDASRTLALVARVRDLARMVVRHEWRFHGAGESLEAWAERMAAEMGGVYQEAGFASLDELRAEVGCG